MTKVYKGSCSKSIFEHVKKAKNGWIVRWGAEERTEDDRVVVTYNETGMRGRPDYAAVASRLIRTKDSLDAELAIQRQREVKPDDFAEYNYFCEAAKAEARKVVGD